MLRKPSLILLILATLCSSSCGVKLPKYAAVDYTKSTNIKPIFPSELNELVFDLAISYGKDNKNKNSGILAVVRDTIDRSAYRTVFMAKTGLKLFDFSFTKKQMSVSHIIPQMDKRIIKKILEKDLRLMFDDMELASSQLKHLATAQSETNTYRYKKKRPTYRLTVDKAQQLIQVEKGKKNRSHVTMNISYENSSPSDISIKHHRIPFSMRLISLSSN